MKTFLKKFLVGLTVLLSVATVTGTIQSAPAYADGRVMGSCNELLLGMKPWDCGLDTSWQGEDIIVKNILIIATNILNDMLAISAYLAIGFIVYGGYLYIFASGDIAKTQNGKKTLVRAFIGLAIIAGAKIIVNSMHIAFLNSSGAFENCVTKECVTASDLVGNALGWFIGTASAVAFIYVVIGAASYLTSAGDPSKLQKAKNTILYAIIGLIVCALSQGILTLFLNTANQAELDANTNALIINDPIIIAKE